MLGKKIRVLRCQRKEHKHNGQTNVVDLVCEHKQHGLFTGLNQSSSCCSSACTRNAPSKAGIALMLLHFVAILYCYLNSL